MTEIENLLEYNKKSNLGLWLQKALSKEFGKEIPLIENQNKFIIKNHKVYLIDGVND